MDLWQFGNDNRSRRNGRQRHSHRSNDDLFLIVSFFLPKFFNSGVHGRDSARLALALGLSLVRASGTARFVTGIMREGACSSGATT